MKLMEGYWVVTIDRSIIENWFVCKRSACGCDPSLGFVWGTYAACDQDDLRCNPFISLIKKLYSWSTFLTKKGELLHIWEASVSQHML